MTQQIAPVDVTVDPTEPGHTASQTLDGFPLSPQQRRAWRLLEAGVGAPRAWSTVRFVGEPDLKALEEALGQLVTSHEILRTRFALLPGMTLPVQIIESAERPNLSEHRVDREEDLEACLAALVAEHGAEGRGARPLCVEWIRVGDRPLSVLLLSLFSLVGDGTTLSCLVAELGDLYAAHRAGAGPRSAAEVMQYADFAQWQNDGLEEEEGAEGRALWRSCPVVGDGRELRFEAPGEAVSGLDYHVLEPAAELGERAAGLAEEMELPDEAVLLAAWLVLLARAAGGDKPRVWTALDGRGYDELEKAAGLYHRLVPVVCALDGGERFRALVERLGERLEEMVLWQEYLAWDVEEAAPGEEPLALDWGFELCDLPDARTVDGVRMEVAQQEGTTEHLQLHLQVRRSQAGFEGSLRFDRARLSAEAVERLAAGYATLLAHALDNPDRTLDSLEILGAAERVEVLEGWNRRSEALEPVAGVGELVFAGLESRADAIAYQYAGAAWSQAALESRSRQMSTHLLSLGIRGEQNVALLLERGPQMAAAFLGVLRSGATAVALSPAHPKGRLERLLHDLQPALVVVEKSTVASLPDTETPRVALHEIGPAEADSLPSIDPDQLAYGVYTSGTSGRPKGIECAHRGVVSYLFHLDRILGLGAEDTVLQLPDPIYDASVRDTFTPLLGGARVIWVSAEQMRDPGALLAVIRRERVTAMLSVVPTVLRALLATARGSGERWPTVHTILSSGEKLRPEDVLAARRFFQPNTRVLNLYGPTECTMTSTLGEMPVFTEGEVQNLSLGRPMAGTALYVVDDSLRPVLPGMPGEGVIGGVGLARGYLGQAARTAESFVPDALSGESGGRLFKTGDLVVHGAAGELELVGRRDQQIKLHGVRVEPGEIEAELRRLDGVKEAAVMARRDSHTEALSLVAWFVSEDPLAAIPEEQRYRLPNGLPIRHLNRYETDFFYQQIFEDRVDMKSGLSLESGAVVFDVGANIGLFSLYAHLAQDDVRLFAFEPIPETCSVLRSNLELYGANAQVECCGVSNRSGSTRFAYYPLSSCQSGYYPDESQERYMLEAIIERQSSDPDAFSVGREYFAELVDRRMQRQMIDCPLKTVSAVMAEHGLERIDLLKIDVEKSELDVLEGIRDEDWSKIEQVSIEAHDLEGRLEKITDLLAARGYRLVVQQEDALLDETCLFNVYATRRPAEAEGVPLEPRLPRNLVEGGVTADSLRRSLIGVLPDALIPAAFVELDAMPRTPGGKLDRRALPEPEVGQSEEVGGPESMSPTEEILGGILATLLEREHMGLDEDFFVLGGHSLLGTQAVLRINRAFEIELPLQRLFESPTVRELAQVVEELRRSRSGRVLPPLVPAPSRENLPLSFAQQRLWFLDQLKPGNPWYNLPGAMRLRGSLEVPVLEATVQALVARHESLRTRFPTGADGVPTQVVEPLQPLGLPLVDLTQLPSAVRAQETERLLREAAHHPFPLDRGPLFRGLLLREDAEQHVVHFNLHHIIGDAWSNSILMREITVLFDALSRSVPSPLPPLPIQYADYAFWQRQWLEGEVLAELLDSWKETLRGAPPVIELPLDHPRGALWQAGMHTVEWPRELLDRIEEMGREHQASLFMVLLTALDTTFHSVSGARDLVVGADVAHRSRIETESLIGFFINQIVLRVDLEGDPTFTDLLARVRSAALDAYERQDLPFDKLVEAVNPDRDAHYAPIFQVKLVVQNTPGGTLSLAPGLEITPLPAESRPASEDLLINAVRSEAGLTLRFKYNAALFVAATIEGLADRLRQVLERGLAEPQVHLSELTRELESSDRARRSQEAEKRGANLGSRLKSVRRRGRR